MENPSDVVPPPAWLYLLSPMQIGWREKQFAKGRNPDSYIEQQLREAGKWPPPNGEPKVGHA